MDMLFHKCEKCRAGSYIEKGALQDSFDQSLKCDQCGFVVPRWRIIDSGAPPLNHTDEEKQKSPPPAEIQVLVTQCPFCGWKRDYLHDTISMSGRDFSLKILKGPYLGIECPSCQRIIRCFELLEGTLFNSIKESL